MQEEAEARLQVQEQDVNDFYWWVAGFEKKGNCINNVIERSNSSASQLSRFDI